ncbi:hypothetical protein WMY93_026576 [Mugilogobius chulae]|uniref:Uncharacterized protein n=1 Tax=Mugilogobius chulae TaxID=88201 RepID=A0AAW0N9U2_9GOBI
MPPFNQRQLTHREGLHDGQVYYPSKKSKEPSLEEVSIAKRMAAFCLSGPIVHKLGVFFWDVIRKHNSTMPLMQFGVEGEEDMTPADTFVCEELQRDQGEERRKMVSHGHERNATFN